MYIGRQAVLNTVVQRGRDAVRRAAAFWVARGDELTLRKVNRLHDRYQLSYRDDQTNVSKCKHTVSKAQGEELQTA
jgi:hypothetical protein